MGLYGAWRTECLKIPVHCVADLGRRSVPHNECPLWRRPQRLVKLHVYLYWKRKNGHCNYVSLERSYNTEYIHSLHKGLSSEKVIVKATTIWVACAAHISKLAGWSRALFQPLGKLRILCVSSLQSSRNWRVTIGSFLSHNLFNFGKPSM